MKKLITNYPYIMNNLYRAKEEFEKHCERNLVNFLNNINEVPVSEEIHVDVILPHTTRLYDSNSKTFINDSFIYLVVIGQDKKQDNTLITSTILENSGIEVEFKDNVSNSDIPSRVYRVAKIFIFVPENIIEEYVLQDDHRYMLPMAIIVDISVLNSLYSSSSHYLKHHKYTCIGIHTLDSYLSFDNVPDDHEYVLKEFNKYYALISSFEVFKSKEAEIARLNKLLTQYMYNPLAYLCATNKGFDVFNIRTIGSTLDRSSEIFDKSHLFKVREALWKEIFYKDELQAWSKNDGTLYLGIILHKGLDSRNISLRILKEIPILDGSITLVFIGALTDSFPKPFWLTSEVTGMINYAAEKFEERLKENLSPEEYYKNTVGDRQTRSPFSDKDGGFVMNISEDLFEQSHDEHYRINGISKNIYAEYWTPAEKKAQPEIYKQHLEELETLGIKGIQ